MPPTSRSSFGSDCCRRAFGCRKAQGSFASFNLVSEKLEALAHVDNPRFLAIERHPQGGQNFFRFAENLGGLLSRATGDDPIICVSRQLIPPSTHLPIKWG